MAAVLVDVLAIIAPLSVMVVVFAQALQIAPGAIGRYFRERPGLMLRSVGAALILVPAATLALLLILKPLHDLAIALAILVTCPPAPLMFSTAPRRSGASTAFMGSLGLTLAAVAMLTVPAVLYLIAWPIGFRAQIHFGQMAWILAKTILIPISLGLTVRALVPDVAERLSRTLGRAGMAGILVVVVFAGMAVLRALFAMDLWSYVVMASIAIAAVAIGHALGPPNPHERTALAVECGVRHPGLAIAIASATYGTERALPVLIPCVITFIVVATVYMSLRRRVT